MADILLNALSTTGVTLTSTGASVADKTASSVGVIDLRAAGTTNLAQALAAYAELTCQFTTITNITVGKVVGEFYMVPAIDATNYADIDTTSGSSYISRNYLCGTFYAHKQFVTATNYRMATAPFDLFPTIYTGYVLFLAGQTVTANWTLKMMAAKGQY